MSRPSLGNFPPPDIPVELRTKLPALLPFGDDKTGLLSRGVGPRSRFRQRISYTQAERLRTGVASELRPYISEVPHEEYVLYNAQPPAPIATRYSEGLQAAVEALADGSLKGRLVSGVLAAAQRLSLTWYDGNRCVALESGILLERATATRGLVHAVALLESNVSPNEWGYNWDMSLKSWGKEHVAEHAAKGVRTACEAVDNNPTLFGDRATTAGLINAVVDRLELHRPMVDGQPVGPAFWRKKA